MKQVKNYQIGLFLLKNLLAKFSNKALKFKAVNLIKGLRILFYKHIIEYNIFIII